MLGAKSMSDLEHKNMRPKLDAVSTMTADH